MRPKILSIEAVILVSLAFLAVAQTIGAAADKWQAPPDAAARPNPEAKNPAAPVIGRKSFMRLCANCHGEDGGGQDSRATDLRSAAVQSQSDGALFWKISKGNTSNGMPSFESVPENERWDTVIFLRRLKKNE